jgi:hypothetical protein
VRAVDPRDALGPQEKPGERGPPHCGAT